MDFTKQQERFAEWMRDHGGILHKVVNGFAEGDNRKDLLQEVLLAVWKSAAVFRGQAKASTYLYRVCHNAALLWARTQRNYKRRIEKFGALQNEEFAPVEGAHDLRLEALYGAIRGLKPVDRSLILMALDGMSYREMAEVLGLSESNVGVKISRIKNQLSEKMKGYGYGNE